MSARAILTGLQPNAAYVVRVRHRNVVGWGQLSAPARVHTSVPPAAPKVSAVESTASTVALLAELEDPRGAPVTDVAVRRRLEHSVFRICGRKEGG